MYVGDPMKVRLRLAPSNIEFLKRKFPEVSISRSQENQWYEAQLEVLGLMGIELWILQQGPSVELVEPPELRENLKNLIGQMYQLYFNPANVQG
jgi:hypothetical protein